MSDQRSSSRIELIRKFWPTQRAQDDPLAVIYVPMIFNFPNKAEAIVSWKNVNLTGGDENGMRCFNIC